MYFPFLEERQSGPSKAFKVVFIVWSEVPALVTNGRPFIGTVE